MIYSDLKTATIDIDRAVEFSGDDVDRYSSLIDFGKPYEKLVIDVPAIDSATITVYVQQTPSTAVVPIPVHYKKTSDEATAAWTTTASTGSLSITVYIGAYQFIRLYTGADQTADRAIKVRGVRE